MVLGESTRKKNALAFKIQTPKWCRAGKNPIPKFEREILYTSAKWEFHAHTLTRITSTSDKAKNIKMGIRSYIGYRNK